MRADFQKLAHISTPTILAELTTHHFPEPFHVIYDEPLHTIALQQSPRQRTVLGRYCLPESRESFRDIGRLLLLPADIPLEVRGSGGPNDLVRCQFTQEMLDRHFESGDMFNDRLLSSCLDIRHDRIIDLLSRIGQELRQPGLATNAMIEALGNALIVEFARFLYEKPQRSEQHRGGLSPRQHRMITEYIESRDDCPSLADLSALIGFSMRHLTRAFKQTTGETVHSHIERVRFGKAQRLLAETDLLMKEIAYRLGFSSSSSFSVAFRKMAGETPQAYRMRMKAWRGRAVNETSH